ncbi:hypothetical protein KIW84_013942 [Lathyrus oleraceus]|uniref:Integrase zinc-binding domain-containing protein n=1 Tax=Pisum sativum TaxID=3888 RepID=A0A9D5BLE7_PEA|nr:hypothetical protein KIW84_013942 [Pisum sativum]
MTPIYNYLTRDELPADPKEATTVKRRACSYVLLEGKLYRRGFSIPLLKCVEEEKVPDILGEIHRGINAQHLGGRSLARKALRAGYYWPTMQNDSKEHVKRYDHALRPQNPREEPRDPGTIRGHITNTTLPDGWDLDQDSTSKYQDWQGTQLAMGGPKPRDQGSNNGPGLRYPRAQSPTLRRFPKPRRLTKSSRVRIHTNKYQTQTSTMNDNENIHTLETIRAAEAKYARRPYYNARRPKYIRHAGHDN